MNEADWRTRMEETIASLREPPHEAETEQNLLEWQLARLWLAMQNQPPSVRAEYIALLEVDIEERTSERVKTFDQSADYHFVPQSDEPLPELVMSCAAEIRALDQILSLQRDTTRPDDPADAYSVPGEGVWVVPRFTAKLDRQHGQDFDRRGLVHHRILPHYIEGLAVKLYTPSGLGTGDRGEPADLVSAVFAAVQPTLLHRQNGAYFRVTGLENEEEIGNSLEVQLGELEGSISAMGVVWPELSLTPALVDRIADRLREGRFQAGFVVAGSWHRDSGGSHSNVSKVLGQTGELLFEITKREAFKFEGSLEDIKPGADLPVLMYGDVLLGFGICKDFCDDRIPSPYRRLDVDFIVIPSFGGKSTMAAHAKAADTLSHGFGTRSFVVQQGLDTALAGPSWGHIYQPATEARGGGSIVAQTQPLARSRVSCV